jgi:hypothetical protein
VASLLAGAGCSGEESPTVKEFSVIDVDMLMVRARAPTGEVLAPSALSEPIPVRARGALTFVVFEYSWFMRGGVGHLSGPHTKYTLDSTLSLIGQEPMKDGAKDLGASTAAKVSDSSSDVELRYRRALAELLPAFARGGELTGTLHGARADARTFYESRISAAHWPYYQELGGDWFRWLGM